MAARCRLVCLAAGCVSVVADGSVVGLVAGDEYGKARVGRVEGGSHVCAVLADGSVDVVSGGSRVGVGGGADGEGVAVVGGVGVDSRVGVLGGYARVGFAVGADGVSDSADAARLLDVRLCRESGGGDGGGGLRVSGGVRRSLYSGEGVSVVLSVVACGGSCVVLDGGGVRRVLCGRPVASSWGVGSVLGSFESSFDRRAGEWMSGAGDVVLRPSGWGDWVEPVAGDEGDEDEWRACGCVSEARRVSRAAAAWACLAVGLSFLVAALFAFVVGRVHFSVARSVFTVACLRSGRAGGGCEGVAARAGGELCVSVLAVWRTGWRARLVCRVFGFSVGVCCGVGVAVIFTW